MIYKSQKDLDKNKDSNKKPQNKHYLKVAIKIERIEFPIK